jgi:hypothetical protein
MELIRRQPDPSLQALVARVAALEERLARQPLPASVQLPAGGSGFSVGDGKLWFGHVTALTGEVQVEPNWLLCNGAAVGRNTWPALFAQVGTVYGAGDGTTTFNLPDARDRMLVAAGAVVHPGDNEGIAYGGARGPRHHHSAAIFSGGPTMAAGGDWDVNADVTSGGGPADTPAFLTIAAVIVKAA